MRIVSIGEPSLCRHYRSAAPIEGLRALGHRAAYCMSAPDEAPRLASVTPEELDGADVILGYRFLYEDNIKLVRQAMARGSAFVWDTDDDFANFPKDTANYKAMRASGLRGMLAQANLLTRMADVVTTTTAPLAEKLSRAGAKETMIVENFLPDGSMRRVKRKGADVVVGWVAGSEHKTDVRSLPIVKAMRRLLAEYPQVRVESAGLKLPLPEDRYRHFPFVPIERLPDLLARWDIGIAPLSDIPFNRCRSDVKLKEYGAAGVAWLASPVGPYADKGEQHGGLHSEDHEWFEAIEELVVAEQLRKRLAKNGHAWATAHQATNRDNARHWERACIAAVERRTQRAAVPA